MQNIQNIFTVNYFWQIACRRKWIMILPFFVTLPVSAFLYFNSPKIYKAETLILVSAQRIPEKYVQSTVIGTVQERLATIRQEIFSRTRLEKIIAQFNLYADLLREIPMEDVVEIMKGKIDLDLKGRNAFSVSFQHQDPHITMDVTNKLAELFIAENLKNREKLASNTTQFLVEEINKIESVLQEKEKVITTFRAQNVGKMPEDRETNLNVINQLISEIDTLSVQVSNAESRKILLHQQMNNLDPFTRSSQLPATAPVSHLQRSPPFQMSFFPHGNSFLPSGKNTPKNTLRSRPSNGKSPTWKSCSAQVQQQD